MLVRSFLIVAVLVLAGCHTPPDRPPRVRFEEKADQG
jgi:hypothetical protein